MKIPWILILLASLAFTGCGGDHGGANKGLDRPTLPKKDKDKDR